MRRTITALLAVSLSAATAPALADWQKMASIDVGRRDQEFSMQQFKGNVIGLTAAESDVMCNRVTAVFADGSTRPLFRGVLRQGLSIRVDLPPGVVDRVTFNCHPIRGEAKIDIAADVGAITGASRG